MKKLVVSLSLMLTLTILLNLNSHVEGQLAVSPALEPPSGNIKEILRTETPSIQVVYQSETLVILRGDEMSMSLIENFTPNFGRQ